MKSKFQTFAEASAFAKGLAQKAVDHCVKRYDSAWLVEYNESEKIDTNQHADILNLRKLLSEKNHEIEKISKDSQSRAKCFLIGNYVLTAS